MTIDGSGTVNLLDDAIDFDLVATMVDGPVLQSDPEMVKYAGKNLPLTVTGTVDAPSVRAGVRRDRARASERRGRTSASTRSAKRCASAYATGCAACSSGETAARRIAGARRARRERARRPRRRSTSSTSRVSADATSLEAEARLAATPESIYAVLTDFDDNALRADLPRLQGEPLSRAGRRRHAARLHAHGRLRDVALHDARAHRAARDEAAVLDQEHDAARGQQLQVQHVGVGARARRREHEDDLQARDGARLLRAAGHRAVVFEAHVVARRAARGHAHRAARARARRPARTSRCRRCPRAGNDHARAAPARVVRRARPPRPAVAARPHAVLRLGLGDHAAADAGRHRDSVLWAVHAAFPDAERACCGTARRRAQLLVRPRLLRAGAQSLARCAHRRRSPRRRAARRRSTRCTRCRASAARLRARSSRKRMVHAGRSWTAT